MKYLILITLATLFSLQSFGQNTVKLSGQITNPTGDSVYLFTNKLEGKRFIRVPLDKAPLNESGKFSLSAKIDSTVEATFTDGNENAPLILSPKDEINMTLNTSFFDETIKYTGNGAEKNNAVMTLYLLEENMNNKMFDKMETSDTASLFAQFNTSHEQYIQLVKDYKKNTIGFNSYADNILSSSERNKKQIKNYVASEIAFKNQMKKIEGIAAVDFEGVDLKGNKTKLSDYKGKVIIVDFWATWCGPCKAEFPAYKELEAKYGKDVNFVSVASFCKEDEWNAMATKEGFQHNIFLSKEAAKQIEAYQVNSIPRYLVIDENFNLVDATAPRPSSGELEAFWNK